MFQDQLKGTNSCMWPTQTNERAQTLKKEEEFISLFWHASYIIHFAPPGKETHADEVRHLQHSSTSLMFQINASSIDHNTFG